MRDTPLVSIGLPIYNGERFLTELLDSLLAQTYPNFELIISDNASTDNTLAICYAYASRDSRISVHSAQANRGSSWNHNRVRELATGVYFKWCGADDVIGPRFLETAVAALEANADAVLAYPLTVVVDESSHELRRTSDRLAVDSGNVAVRFRATLKPIGITHCIFYGLFRVALLSRARPIGAFLANDRCLMGELTLYGPFVRVEELLMYRRVHDGNAARSRSDEQRLNVPNDTRTIQLRELTVLREALRSVARAPVGPGTRLRLLATIAMWTLATRRDFLAECDEVVKQRLRGAVARLGIPWRRTRPT